jgi:hypothetical protein
MDLLQCICYQVVFHSGTWAHIVGETNARLESNALLTVFKVSFYLFLLVTILYGQWLLCLWTVCLNPSLSFSLNLIWTMNFISLFLVYDADACMRMVYREPSWIYNLARAMLPTQILVELYICGNTENLLFLPLELIWIHM